ncbi:MAG: helix-turn-helix transcriptional regulator [Prevotella sp.]|nr:helix-turn-helix transcriptional regulator [Prevotella sp.]
MYDQIRGDIIYIMLYAGVTTLNIVISCYLLFRRGNAFAPDIIPPVRLRRWTAAFLAVLALSHIWYMPILFLSSREDIILSYFIGGLLDSITVFPLAIIVLLVMLQDRRRPLWPAVVIVAPLVFVMAMCVANRNEDFLPVLYVYLPIMLIGLIIYLVRAVRLYGNWLCDNFADLEHKEVGQSFVALAIILLIFTIYMSSSDGPVFQYTTQILNIILIGYLLWRVETLSDLSTPQLQSLSIEETTEKVNMENDGLSLNTTRKIELLLQQYCIDAQLYLQHDLTLSQLAKTIGTNRFYLSQYFSSQGISYNAYINNLRINHFISLYRKAIAKQQSSSVQQLAHDSGYRSYSTFSLAFKRRMGQTVTEWTREKHLSK